MPRSPHGDGMRANGGSGIINRWPETARPGSSTNNLESLPMSTNNQPSPPTTTPAQGTPPSTPPTGQTPVPGGLIGVANVQPGGTVFRTGDSTNPTTSRLTPGQQTR